MKLIWVYQRFLEIADQKKEVYDEDLESMVQERQRDIQAIYTLNALQVSYRVKFKIVTNFRKWEINIESIYTNVWKKTIVIWENINYGNVWWFHDIGYSGGGSCACNVLESFYYFSCI